MAVSGAFDGGGWELGWSSAEALLGRGMQEQGPCWAGRALPAAGASPHPLPAWPAGKAPLAREPRPGERLDEQNCLFFSTC